MNKVVGFGSITLATPLQYNHPAGATVQDLSTTTPAATVTPIAPLVRRYSENAVAAKEEQGQWASHALYLGAGCFIGMSVLMVVQNLRSRMGGASTEADANEVSA